MKTTLAHSSGGINALAFVSDDSTSREEEYFVPTFGLRWAVAGSARPPGNGEVQLTLPELNSTLVTFVALTPILTLTLI